MALSLFPLLFAASAENEEDLLGVYANQAEGFYGQSLFLSKNNRAFYFSSVIGVPVQWRFDSTSSKIAIKGNLGENMKVEERVFEYIPESHIIITNRNASSPENPTLKFIQKEIPEKVQRRLDSFDWDFSKHEIKTNANRAIHPTPSRVTLRASRYARHEMRHGQVLVTADVETVEKPIS